VYAAWAKYRLDRKHERALFERTFKRLTNVKLLAGFTSWFSKLEAERQLRKAMDLVLRRVSNYKLAGGFGRWEEVAACTRHEATMAKMLGDCKQECLEEAEQQQLELTIQLRCKSIVNRWKNGLLTRVYGAWVVYAQTEVRNRYLVSKFVSSMKARRVQACLQTWVGLRDERQLCRRVMQKVIGCYTKRGMLAGFSSWKDSTIKQKSEELEHGIKMRLFTRFLRWSDWRDIGAAFGLWKETSREHKETTLEEKSAKMTALVVELKRRLKKERMDLIAERSKMVLLGSWKAWAGEVMSMVAERRVMLQVSKSKADADADVLEKEALEASLQHQREQMIEQRACQVLRRWKNALLYRVFDGLLRYAEESKRNRYLVSKFVQTWKLKGVRACVNRWGEFTEERQLCRRVMQKLIGRYSKQGLLAGWIRWREWWYNWRSWIQSVETARAAHEAGEHAALEEKKVREQQLDLTAKHEQLRLMFFDKCAALGFLNQQKKLVARVWRAWMQFRVMEQAERQKGADMVRAQGLEEQVAKQRQQMIESKSRQVLMRWKNMLLYKCFDGMRKFAAEEKRSKYLVGKFVTNMKLRGARSCYNRWTELAYERQLCRRVMKKLIGRYTKQGILGTLARNTVSCTLFPCLFSYTAANLSPSKCSLANRPFVVLMLYPLTNAFSH
jgi:hypothetical protein